MKQIFEIDMKGDKGNTIKNIISFSKACIGTRYADPVTRFYEYTIEVEYHNGLHEILEFTKEVEL